jgi:mannitol operon transcriptional antiterminator
VTPIPPRLGRILTLLLEENAPVTVDRLAKELGVGRRTIFRELENADFVLEGVDLLLNTLPGRGMTLVGGDAAKAELKSTLDSAAVVRPKNQSDRRAFLTLLLLDAGEMQKLYYFARALDVSEATVSGDLDKLESFFSSQNLRLARRQSQGIEVTGREADIRRAMADVIGGMPNLLSFSKNFGCPSAHVLRAIDGTLEGEWFSKLDWMTGESLEMLKIRLVVMVERVLKHRMLDDENETITGLPGQLAGQLCDALESLFSVRLPERERASVGTFIRASRAKQLSPLNVNDAAAYGRVQNLACRMIDAFDPRLSHSLKLNEDLVRGLSLHLWSAIVRLKRGIQLNAAMREQLARDFPEVYAKSAHAAQVLEREYGVPVPESEVAFIASHFGAALMHYGERRSRRVVLKAGIVCVAGVGVSYMMASQVRGKFRGQLEVTVSDWNNPEEWANFDLLISSIPLEHEGCPVVVVNAILEPADYEAIRRTVENHNVTAEEEMPRLSGALPQRLEKAAARFSEMGAMLRNFGSQNIHSQTIHADCTFDELAKTAGYLFGRRPESGGQIYRDLKEREAISTQVVAQLGIVLLHARTEGVRQPVIGLISPEGSRFTDPYFQNAKGCVVMLVPAQSDKDLLEVFGCISGALVEDEVLLAAVQTGDQPVACTRVEAAMLQYLKDYWNEKLDV